MKHVKRLITMLFAVFMLLTTCFPIYADTQDAVYSNFQMNVVGNGSVQIEDDEKTYSIGSDESFDQMFLENTKLKITVKTNGTIDDVALNGKTISGFKTGRSSLKFQYTVTDQDAILDVIFKEREEKTNSSDIEDSQKIDQQESDIEPEISQEIIEDGITIDFSDESLPTDEELAIIENYGKGITEKYTKLRKEKAEETGLLKYCDDEYFMNDDFYEKYGANMLLHDGAIILDRKNVKGYKAPEMDLTMADNQVEVPAISKSKKSVRVASYLSVTEMGYHRLYNGVGYMDNGIWRLSNGALAFCGQGMNASPHVGEGGNTMTVNNANVRKALFYGYGGPGDVLTGRYGTSGSIVITNDILSVAYSGQSVSMNTVNGYHWRTLINGLYNEIMAKPDPAGYTVYGVDVSGYGTHDYTGAWVPKQDLLWGEYNPTGELQISKVSTNPDITDGNDCYKLEGTQYGLFTDAGATNQINTLTIGANGWSNTVGGLTAGTYYLKEIKAPQGYALDTKIYSIQVNGGSKATMEMKDYPQSDPIRVLLGKIDAETNANKPQGSASLEGAEFTVKYYKGLYDSDPAEQDKKAERQWVIRTDSDGYCGLSDTYKVSGDDFYYSSNGVATLPLGTITIEETKAPEGYYVNDEVFVRQITSDGTLEGVNTYNEPKIPEQVIKFRIHKAQIDTMTAIKGAVFTHTKPDGSKEELTTDELGNIEIVGLETGKHSIQEKSVPDGYEINPTKVEFEVKSGGQIVVLTDLTDTGISQAKETDGNTLLTVTDKVTPYDLKLVKINDHDKLLDGAEFTLYSDPECTKVVDVQTTENGTLAFKDLEDRTNYYFKETKAPAGYRIPLDPLTKQPHVYRVYVESTPAEDKFNFWIDDVMYTINNTNTEDAVHLEGTVADRVISVRIVNYVGSKLPETGGYWMIPLFASGIGSMTYALSKGKRRKETK